MDDPILHNCYCTVNVEYCETEKCEQCTYFAFDAKSDDDTIIYGNHNSSSSDKCENMSSDEFSSDTVCDPLFQGLSHETELLNSYFSICVID